MAFAIISLSFERFIAKGISMKYAWILFVVLLVSCGGNEMTNDRAQKALEGFTRVDREFLEYDEGRSMGAVSGVIQNGENSVEIMFTLVNPPCNGCQPTSNGKATARMTTDGKWILDCVGYENEFGDWITGRQSCNLNQDMDELASASEYGDFNPLR